MMTETSVTVIPDNNAGARQVPTVKTDPGQPGAFAGLTLNIAYYKTIPGILKLVQVFLGIICMACGSPGWGSAAHWFLFVVVSAFIASLLWIFVYLFSIREALKLPINWILSELINHAVITALYVTGAVAILAAWAGWSGVAGRFIAAGVFGIFNSLAYGAGTYFLYLEWQSANTQ